ncbi:hypothetical protein E0Z10_g10054 [Xylaria hypoxylon]|uniref:Uncharacterized protein n=1 Tax=Xylaria hypoxylon TaxID=37992 RepID=A0A4Z0YFN1_9PEZI|nr:hypothetical protein E0Z10_g10054 [Xylaria hypoxylon]
MMRSPTTFHVSTQLPKEIRDMIWKFHREHRGIRHYFTESPHGCRHYAAVDIETGLFARTILTPRIAGTYWDDGKDRPIKGESDAKIRLIGYNYVSKPDDFAKSVATAKYPRTWRKVAKPYIRMNYTTDVVVLEGIFVCLKPVFPLQHSLPGDFTELDEHWLTNVRYLAVNVASCRMSVENPIATLVNLEHLYLDIYRDPECRYGAPRHWKDFDKTLLDTRNFLPFIDFINLHPSHPSI